MYMNKKVVVFDLDETLGFFTQFGIFCEGLNDYFQNNNFFYEHFNSLLDLYPEFLRPNILTILNYIVKKKKEGECYKIMMYTNNQGGKKWLHYLKKYFEYKLDSLIFDKIIGAFKIQGQKIELNRTSHNKSFKDFINCTKLPDNIELCFIDDVFHEKMIDEKVFYINVKPYVHNIEMNMLNNRFLNSTIGKNVVNKEEFTKKINEFFKLSKYLMKPKTKKEQDIDNVVTKKMFLHIKQFFYENNKKSLRKKKRKKKQTLKIR